MKVNSSKYNPQAYFFELDPPLPIVTGVIKFDYSHVTGGYRSKKHLHHYHQLDVILEGEFGMLLDYEEKYVGRIGDAWIIPPLVWHAIESPHDFTYASFKFHLAPRYWSLFGTKFQHFRLSDHLRQSVDAVGKRCLQHGALASQQVASVISLCLTDFLDQIHPANGISDSLDEFRHQLWPLLEKIQREPSTLGSVEQMAGELNLSRDYFSRCFRRVIGQSPHRYVLETAMRHAAESLLEEPDRPIKKIAGEAGYTSVQAFTRAFTQVFRISPAAYRMQFPSD